MTIGRDGVVGVLGPNGAGKSTLFRLLTGLTRQTTGNVEVLGEEPGWRLNHKVAYLPDRARWYPKHSVAKAFEWGDPSFRFLTGPLQSGWQNG